MNFHWSMFTSLSFLRLHVYNDVCIWNNQINSLNQKKRLTRSQISRLLSSSLHGFTISHFQTRNHNPQFIVSDWVKNKPYKSIEIYRYIICNNLFIYIWFDFTRNGLVSDLFIFAFNLSAKMLAFAIWPLVSSIICA